MRKILYALAMLISISASAQMKNQDLKAKHGQASPVLKLTRDPDQNFSLLKDASSSKTESTNSRQIGYRQDEYNAGSWDPTDSSAYSYTGTHGYNWYWGWLYDTSYYRQYDAGNWDYIRRYFQIINASNLVTLYERQDFNAGTYDNNYRYALNYDADGRPIEETDYDWNAGTMAWEETYRYHYTYNGDSWDYLTSVEEHWDGTQWQYSDQYIYTYDADGNETSEVSQTWNAGAWENYNQYTYSYDANGLMTGYVEQLWNAGAWENYYKVDYTYDANGHETTETTYNWNSGTMAWDNAYRYSFTYDADGNEITYTGYQWDGSNWVNNYRYLYTYDADGYTTSYHRQNWNTGTSTWDESYKVDYTYNSYHQETSYYYSDWVAGAWEYDYRYFYSYELYEDGTTNISAPLATESSSYPNPFVSNTMISFNNAVGDNAVLTVTDLSGKVVANQNIGHVEANYQFMFDGTSLSNGVYFYSLQTFNGTSVGRLVKAK